MTERYSNLRYPVHRATQPLDVAFPELFRLPEFKKLKSIPEWEKITKYIVFMYSSNTDLLSEFPSNLKDRKEAAAIDAGFVKTKTGWPKSIQDVMDVNVIKVNDAIFAYLKKQKHVVFTEIVVTEQELYEFQKLRFLSIEVTERKKRGKKKDGEDSGSATTDKDVYDAAKKKDALKDACEKRIKYLESLYEQFYGDSKTELMNAEFSEMITPETAERIMKDEPAPYEEIKSSMSIVE